MLESRERRKTLFAVLVAALMVASALAAISVAVPAAARTSAPPSAAPANLATGPQTQVAPASAYNPTGASNLPPAQSSLYAIAPDNAAFSATQPILLQVTLTPSASLSLLESNVNNPSSAQYRQYLNIGGIANAAGVSPSTYAGIVSYFASFGITVSMHSDLLTLGLSGTPAQLSAAFHTHIQAFSLTYTDSNVYNPVFDQVVGSQQVVVGGVTLTEPVWQNVPRVFYANTAGLTLPQGVAQYVNGVSGFGVGLAQPEVQTLYQNYPSVANSYSQVMNSTGALVSGSSFGYSPDWKKYKDPVSLGVSSGSVANSCAANYSWAPLFGETVQLFFPSTMPTLTGACTLFTGADTLLSEPDYGQGVTIAVIEVGALDPSQLAAFSSLTFGKGVGPNGLTTDLLSRTTFIDLGAPDLNTAIGQGFSWGWTGETALDIEYAATMAPEAHIDLVSIPAPYFSFFDEAYSFIMANLVGHSTCSIPASDPVLGPVFVYGATSDANGGSACAISITSNSYGSGETFDTYFGSPMYTQVEQQLIEEMAIMGVTNFFASGDAGGVATVVSDFHPAASPGSITVGGGQMTASDRGVEFPNTGVYYFLTTCGYWCGDFVEIAPATNLQSFTYWSNPSGEGTFNGVTGGGFGESIRTVQQWWQAGPDTYTTGARFDPTISSQAAFNMTYYYDPCEYFGYFCGPWQFIWGGTSFATPITAGGWALIEEQLNLKYGLTNFGWGDIGALLFESRNANLAGAPTVYPFIPMTNIGFDYGGIGDYAPVNSYAWYLENISVQVPNAVDHPWWFASLFNPAIPPGWTDAKFMGGASAWNGLQGLGQPNWDLLDQVLVGQTDSAHALLNAPFYVEQVTPAGDVSVGGLVCGHSYEFQIVTAVAPGNAVFQVVAYSGTPDDGTMYGGGVASTIIVNPATDSALTFSYTPLCPPPTNNGPTSLNNTGWYYGYFLVTQETSNPAGTPWTFQQFGTTVYQPGTLNLCMSDAFDVCQSSVAEETMFNTYDVSGYYNLQGQANAFVTLTEPDGQTTPVESAVVTQVSVVTDLCPGASLTQAYSCDPFLNPATYAPGATIGSYLTDSRGTADIWDNAFIAESSCQTPAMGLDNEFGYSSDGSQPIIPPVCVQTQVYTITAFAFGLVSNTVTVYVEPQMGTFYPQLTMNGAGQIVGFVQFNQMTNVQYVNISIGSAPGEYDNVSFLPACAPPGIVSVFGSDGLTYYPENPGNYCLTSGAGVPPVGPIPQEVCQLGNPSAFYDATNWLCGSGVKEGVIEVQLTPTGGGGPDSAPLTVSMVAVGWNDLSINEGCFEGICFVIPDTQFGLYWQDPLVFLPTHLSASATGTVTGTDTFTFSGTAFQAATGQLSLVSAAGTQVLATGLSGSYTLDTSALADGYYQAVYTEINTGGAIASTQTVSFYAGNAQAALSATIASLNTQLTTATTTIAALTAQVAALNSELATDAASIASLTAQVTSLTGQLTALQSQLSAAQAQVTSLQAQIAQLQATNAANAQQITSLQAQLATAQATISTDASQITSLQAQVAQLQQELAKKQTAPAATVAWYDTSGGAVIVLLVAVAAIAGILGTYAAMRTRRRTEEPEGGVPSSPVAPRAQPAAASPQLGTVARKAATVRADESPEALRRAVIRSLERSVSIQRAMIEQGRLYDAAKLNGATRELAEEYWDVLRP
jgi:subtilase family serine protease